jgi:hypothetical protein
MKGREPMNKVWMKSPAAKAPILVHSDNMAGDHSIPRNFRGNALIEHGNPELSRSGASPISYQLS